MALIVCVLALKSTCLCSFSTAECTGTSHSAAHIQDRHHDHKLNDAHYKGNGSPLRWVLQLTKCTERNHRKHFSHVVGATDHDRRGKYREIGNEVEAKSNGDTGQNQRPDHFPERTPCAGPQHATGAFQVWAYA